jgi:hypothetical protein
MRETENAMLALACAEIILATFVLKDVASGQLKVKLKRLIARRNYPRFQLNVRSVSTFNPAPISH